MSEFILLLIVGVAWIWGVHCPFSTGYVFSKIGGHLWEKWPHWICKPLFVCPPCMSSIHGFAISAVYFDFHIFTMMAYMVCLCGINYILKSMIYE